MLEVLMWILFIWIVLVLLVRFLGPYIMLFLMKRLQKKMMKNFGDAFGTNNQKSPFSEKKKTDDGVHIFSDGKEKTGANESKMGEYVDFEDIPNK